MMVPGPRDADDDNNKGGNDIEAKDSKLKAWNLGNPKTSDSKKPRNPRKPEIHETCGI